MPINFADYETGNRPVLDDGSYEMVLVAKVKQTKDQTSDYLNIGFKIREDVDQKYNDGHSYVFRKIFRDKNNPEWYDLTECASILATQKGKPGYRTQFDEVDEFIQYINGATLVVDIQKKMDDYFGKEVNFINFSAYNSPYHASKAGPYTASTETPVELDELGDGAKGKNLDNGLDITDDMLPF